MSSRNRTILSAICAGVGGFVVCTIVGAGPSRAMSPCRPSTTAPLTGTLVEVRQGDTVVPNEQAILKGVPRRACLSPDRANPRGMTVTVGDCDFPEYTVNATLVP
jgi:hypothetical protein